MAVRDTGWTNVAVLCTLGASLLGCLFFLSGRFSTFRHFAPTRFQYLTRSEPSLVYHWGFIDRTGKFVIRPKFSSAYDFRGGFAQVLGDGITTDRSRYTEIDKDGVLYTRQLGAPLERTPKQKKQMMELFERPSDSKLKSFELAQEKSGHICELYGFVNERGAVVIPAKFDWVHRFHEGLCAVLVGERWSYIDEHGHEVIKLPESVSGCSDFSDGIARVAVGGEGRASEARIGSKWGFIDRRGHFVIEPKFDVVDWTDPPTFVNGLAKVCVEENRIRRFGYIDRSGKLVIKPIFNAARNFSEGLAAVSIGPENFVSEEWKRYPENRTDMCDKLFRSYNVVGMSVSQLHKLLGDPEEYDVKRLGNTKDPCESYMLRFSNCGRARWVHFQYKDGRVTRYAFSYNRERTTRWTDDGSAPSDVFCPRHHDTTCVQLDDDDSVYCYKCEMRF